MTIRELVNAADGLVEVPRVEWLSMLRAIENVTSELHALWRDDLIAGAENANGAQFVSIEKTQAAKMCELAGE